MKTVIADILADPCATETELMYANDWGDATVRKQVLAHPNCPVSLWQSIGTQYPEEAQQSILWGIFSLEDPILVRPVLVALGKQRQLALVESHFGLSMQEWHRLAADCLERVLPIYLREYNDPCVWQTIQVRRMELDHQGRNKEWDRWQSKAYLHFQELHRNASMQTPQRQWRAIAVVRAVKEGNPAVAMNWAASAVATTEDPSLQYLETNWQWDRLQEYRQKEAIV